MKESEETKKSNFFKIIIFLVDIATQVFRKYIQHKLPPEQDLYEFLSVHRHALYHKWFYNTPCCSSKCEIEAKPFKKPEICLMHIETMYNTDGPEKDGHEQLQNGKALQHCLCKVSVKSGVYIGALDLTTCYRLLGNFFIITSQEKKWLKCIIKQQKAINKHLHDKSLEHNLFETMWEQLEIPVLLMAADIDKSFSDEINGQVKKLAKTTPSVKNYVRCYETYLEWFSRDEVLRQEVKHAKLQQRETLSTFPENGNRKMLVIIEAIVVNLLKNTDDVPTAVEGLPSELTETKDDRVDTEKNKSMFTDMKISGANSAMQLMTDVSTTDTGTLNVNGKPSEGHNKEPFNSNISNDVGTHTQTEAKKQEYKKDTLTNQKFYETNIILDIPSKTRWQSKDILNKIEKILEVKHQLIRMNSVSMDQDNIMISAKMPETVFQTRESLRCSLTDFLHMIFKLCGISDCFSVNVTIKVFDSDNIDATRFNTKEPTESDLIANERKTTRQLGSELSSSVPEKADKPKCVACKVKDQEIFNLHKQVKTLQAKNHVTTTNNCKECLIKEKRISLFEKEQIKIGNENEQKNRLISALQSDLESKEITITTFTKLQNINSILDKQITIGNHLKQTVIPHLTKHPKPLFFTRPTSEPPEVIKRFPHLSKTNGQLGLAERPISEQVLKTTKIPSVSKTQRKYLSSIQRYAEFVPIGKLSVLGNSYSYSRCKGLFKFPAVPSFMSLTSTTFIQQRPMSIRGKHVIAENVDNSKESKVTEAEKRSKIVLHLPRM